MKINEPIKRSSFDSCPEYKSQTGKRDRPQSESSCARNQLRGRFATSRVRKLFERNCTRYSLNRFPELSSGFCWRFRNVPTASRCRRFIEFGSGRKSWRVTRDASKERNANSLATVILTNVIIRLIPGPIPADYNHTKRSAAPAQSGAALAVSRPPPLPA